MKKRILSFVIILVMTLGFLPTISFADTKTYGDLTYDILEDKVIIIDCDESATTIDIPATIEGYPVTSIGSYAFADCESLTSITIPDGITSIGMGAFENCSSLTSITIPNSVTSIGDSAFYGTGYFINEQNWENGILYIGNYLIKAKTDLTGAYDIKQNTRLIVEKAFYNCSGLTSITIPNSVTAIDVSTFLGCTSLTSVSIPDSVTAIGVSAFLGCTSLTTVTLPDSVTSIGSSAFESCTNLNTINIPNNVTSIGRFAFYKCKNLTSITIPEGVTSIDQFTFGYCESLSTVTIPNSLTFIGLWTFYQCFNIQTVNYAGSESDRANISIAVDNGTLLTATWIYNFHYHKYDNACDTTCNVCGATRETAHTFGDYIYNNDANEKADGTKTRTCSVCGHKDTVTATGTKWQSSFTDIKTKDFYYKPTLWAVANDITTGTSKTTFSPNEVCTRGQVVTFLWRAAGCPEPKSNTMPFTDVGNKAFYRKAILWAVEKNITKGTTATTFGPSDSCTRGQIVTFLYRAYN